MDTVEMRGQPSHRQPEAVSLGTLVYSVRGLDASGE